MRLLLLILFVALVLAPMLLLIGTAISYILGLHMLAVAGERLEEFASMDHADTAIAGVIGIAGTLLGSYVTYVFEVRRAQQEAAEEQASIAETLYLEICDYAARCCFDYDEPWQQYTFPLRTTQSRSIGDVTKFRPADPTVFPALGHKLSVVPGDAKSKAVRFYSALERWRREIDHLRIESPGLIKDGMLLRLQRRLGETLRPALAALEALGRYVPSAATIDADHFEAYYAMAADERRLRRIGTSSLRRTLSELADVADKSKTEEAIYLSAMHR